MRTLHARFIPLALLTVLAACGPSVAGTRVWPLADCGPAPAPEGPVTAPEFRVRNVGSLPLGQLKLTTEYFAPPGTGRPPPGTGGVPWLTIVFGDVPSCGETPVKTGPASGGDLMYTTFSAVVEGRHTPHPVTNYASTSWTLETAVYTFELAGTGPGRLEGVHLITTTP